MIFLFKSSFFSCILEIDSILNFPKGIPLNKATTNKNVESKIIIVIISNVQKWITFFTHQKVYITRIDEVIYTHFKEKTQSTVKML